MTNDNVGERDTSQDTQEMENSQNQEENSQELPEEEENTQNNVQDNVQDDSSKNKQLFERTKKAEEKAKRLEAELLALKKAKDGDKTEQPSGETDVYSIAKQVSALKDFSEDELDVVERYAKTWGMSLQEAAKHEDVQTLLKARREKVQIESKVPEPSTRQPTQSKDFSSWTQEDVANASIDEVDAYRKWVKGKR